MTTYTGTVKIVASTHGSYIFVCEWTATGTDPSPPTYVKWYIDRDNFPELFRRNKLKIVSVNVYDNISGAGTSCYLLLAYDGLYTTARYQGAVWFDSIGRTVVPCQPNVMHEGTLVLYCVGTATLNQTAKCTVVAEVIQ